ncbi:transcriptional regulator, TetR family [Pseudooceanicola antarcticus]|uniref:TetR/AcrR family transcriptional regulator n=1 Tax=Pseudooceanicola antarcticus TaxID=1247613 RepID=A0A285IMK2_9RHOB|nr:TetR/AcrR family transcriptional regulator [Pseudooceanicola antarcticus]PJE28760.1 TetR/AcrR family transcriptional regulator [Pseudooceanicola antarcticus]SNY48336.1 transcriptional regulator, TetR family [Pseudooceanicola antarcticus]
MSQDHRSKVAAERREKMRRRLVEAAVMVFAAKPQGDVVIEDVVARAEVSRGTFYKYFDSLDELLVTVKMAIGHEVLEHLAARGPVSTDPAEALAYDIKSFILTVRRYRTIGRFSASLGLGPGELIIDMVPDYMTWGVSKGRFCDTPCWLFGTVLKAGVISVMLRIMSGEGEAEDSNEAVALILRSLGIPPDEAQRLSATPGQELEAPPGTLIARVDEIRRSQGEVAH